MTAAGMFLAIAGIVIVGLGITCALLWDAADQRAIERDEAIAERDKASSHIHTARYERDQARADQATAERERDAAVHQMMQGWQPSAGQELPHRHPDVDQVIADLERQFQDGAS